MHRARFGYVLAALFAFTALDLPRAFAQDAHDPEPTAHSQDGFQFAEAPPRRQSRLMWLFNALGYRYGLAIPFVACLSFVLAIVLVLQGRTWATGPATLLVVAMPLLVGLLGAIDGLIMSFSVISMSEAAPKPSELAEGYSTALVAPFVALILSAPAYLVAMVGLLVRAVTGERPSTKV